jgi:hypothetical protein
MDQGSRRAASKLSTVRLLVPLIAVACLMSSLAPFVISATSNLCTMECCAGKPPHVAGSCMHESCESPIAQTHKQTRSEVLCGSPGSLSAHPVAAHRTHANKRTRLSSASPPVREVGPKSSKLINLPALTSGIFSKPCPPDCGAASIAVRNEGKSRDSIVVSHAQRPRPPTELHRSNIEGHLTQLRTALCRQCAGRAPPAVVS